MGDEIIITTEAENDVALAELEYLLNKDKLTDGEAGYIDRLTNAIEKFEDVAYPMDGATNEED